MRVLLVDDDKKFCEVLKRGLEENSYAVDCVYNGEDGENFAESVEYDLVILDIMMPKKDGLEVCRYLRTKYINTPILMLTGKDTVDDRVKGLDAGADDYIVKPFAFNELLARVRALLRREGMSKTSTLKVGNLVLNTITREVFWKEKLIDLTTKEYIILEYLMRHPNAIVTRAMIENHSWDFEFDSMSNLVDVYIRRIRQKIDPEEGKVLIQTIRGTGYRIKAK
ncbi:MAG: response regulator transcription factor [Desulfobacterales bacterium]|nr:response regulator transcription factor [Desulfobacterales bacterium]